MLDGIKKYTKTRAWTYKQWCKYASKQRKPNKMAQSKHGGHKGSKACYHTKGKGKHVIRHLERLTWETLTCKAKQKRKNASEKQAKHYEDVFPHMVASKQATKRYGCNQTSKWPQRPLRNKPIKGKQTRTRKETRTKQTSMVPKQKAHGKKSNNA